MKASELTIRSNAREVYLDSYKESVKTISPREYVEVDLANAPNALGWLFDAKDIDINEESDLTDAQREELKEFVESFDDEVPTPSFDDLKDWIFEHNFSIRHNGDWGIVAAEDNCFETIDAAREYLADPENEKGLDRSMYDTAYALVRVYADLSNAGLMENITENLMPDTDVKDQLWDGATALHISNADKSVDFDIIYFE